jgi:hypothetical protein
MLRKGKERLAGRMRIRRSSSVQRSQMHCLRYRQEGEKRAWHAALSTAGTRAQACAALFALFSQHSLYNSQSPCAAEAVRFGDECESNAECAQVATVLLVCPHIPDDFGPFAEIVAAFDEGCAQVQRQARRLAVRSSSGVKVFFARCAVAPPHGHTRTCRWAYSVSHSGALRLLRAPLSTARYSTRVPIA